MVTNYREEVVKDQQLQQARAEEMKEKTEVLVEVHKLEKEGGLDRKKNCLYWMRLMCRLGMN